MFISRVYSKKAIFRKGKGLKKHTIDQKPLEEDFFNVLRFLFEKARGEGGRKGGKG
jgi:hypothetical protein